MWANTVKTIRFLFALLLLLGLSRPAGAQSTKLSMERLGFDTLPDLKVYITYVEGDGTPITGRNPSDFKLLLDSADVGAGTKATTFEAAKEPIYLVAVIQASSAMDTVMEEVKKGLRYVADSISNLPGSKMGLLAYSGDVKRLVEMGTPSEIGSAISEKLQVDPEGAEMHMLDAVRIAIDQLQAQDKNRRKLIVVFSDGLDANNEKKNFVEIGRRAEKAGIVIDTIGYNPFEGSKLRSLVELTKNTYGVGRVCSAPAEIGTRFSALVDEILKQYVVTFPLTQQGDDKEHLFQIISETGATSDYGQTVSRVLPSKRTEITDTPPPPPPPRNWKWLLLLLLIPAAYLLYRLLRKKQEAVAAGPADQPKLEAPLPSAARANRTLAIEAGGDVVMGWVMGLTGSSKDKTFKLKSRTVIGTAADCDIVIADTNMSQHHCEIRQVEGGFKMVDLGSTNGMIVNDKREKEHFLVDNDVFRLGRTEFKFKSIIS